MSRRDPEFGVLANKHRRKLLVALREHNLQPTEGALPENVLLEDMGRDELQIQFRHNHLPRLEAAGLIDWNRGTDEIVKGPNFAEIQPLLEMIESHYDEFPTDGV